MSKVKKSELQSAARELNELLVPKPKIKCAINTPEETIITGIREAAPLFDPAEGDKITVATAETLKSLGIEIPEGIGIIKEIEEGVEETARQAKEEKKLLEKGKKGKQAVKKEKPPFTPKGKATKKAVRYTRSHALVDALSADGTTKAGMAGKANELYVKNGGIDNMHVTCSLLDKVLPVLVLLGAIKEAGKGVYRKT